jgi:hypothetical protein
VMCGFAYTSPYTFTPGRPTPGRATLLRHPFGLPTTSLVRGLSRLIPKDFVSITRLASPDSAWAHLSGYGNLDSVRVSRERTYSGTPAEGHVISPTGRLPSVVRGSTRFDYHVSL